MRAAAILSVLAFHYTSRFPPQFYNAASMPFRFPYGHFGVDLFFTVSGFCIFMTLDSARSLENFWARRLARIQPAYIAAILVTFFVVHVGHLPDRGVSPMIAVSNMIWLNVVPGWPMVDSAYWSLVVELKFYLWIGLIYYLARGRHVSLIWGGFSTAEIALALCSEAARKASDGLVIGSFAPAFLAGLLAYEWPKLKQPERVGLACLTLVLLYLSPRFRELPWVGAAICTLGFGILRARWLKIPRPTTFVGLISYSLYLLHQNIGYVVLRSLPIAIEFRLVIALMLVVALAALFYWLVERRWERVALKWIERVLGHGRRFLPLPRRQIPHGNIDSEMRAW